MAGDSESGMNWEPGTFSTETAKEETIKAIEFLSQRASEISLTNGKIPFAELHEHYAKAISAYVGLLEEGLKANAETIRTLEGLLTKGN